MKKSQIIKKDVKPILTPVEKIRYSQASSFFIKGMNSYLQNYVMGIKEMVDTKQVTAHYSKQYKTRASQLVERFNNAKDEMSKHKRKVVPFLLIFSAGGYLLYRTMKYIGEKFQKEMNDFNNFVSDVYHLFKTPVSKVLSFTKEWSIRIFGGGGFDLQKALYDFMCFIPDLIGGMFNFIVNGFDFLFNKSELFTSILIQTAKHAWNASFSSAWGWVLSIVFNKAKLKQRQIAGSASYAKFGPDVQRDIIEIDRLYEKYFTGQNAKMQWRGGFSAGFLGGYEWQDEGKLATYSYGVASSPTTYGELLNSMVSGTLQHDRKIPESIRANDVYSVVSVNTLDTSELPDYSNYQFRLQSYYSSGSSGSVGYMNTPGVTGTYSAGGGHYVYGNVSFTKMWVKLESNNDIIMRLDAFYKKYKFLEKQNDVVKSYIAQWKSITDIHDRKIYQNPTWSYRVNQKNMVRLLRLSKAWVLFQYQYSQQQYIVQGIRFHSRLQQSEVDNLRDNYLVLNQNFSRNAFNQIDMMFKKYNDEEYSFSDYVRAACEWMFGQVAHNFYRPVSMTLNILEHSYGFSESDTVRWRTAWGIPAIERKLIQIRDLLKALHYQQQYGNSYLNGDIYFFSDQVSDASLIGDMQSQLYQGVFGARSQANPQGIEVGTYNVSGVGRNATDTLGNKSSLAYAVRQLIGLYVEYRKNVRNLRQQRIQLISEIKRKLHFLAVCRYVYNKKNADNVWQPRLIIDPQSGQMREVPPTTDTFVARNK